MAISVTNTIDARVDIALDLCLLGLGATGAIFINPTLIKHWGGRTALYGIMVVLSDLILGAVLVYMRKFRPKAVEENLGKG